MPSNEPPATPPAGGSFGPISPPPGLSGFLPKRSAGLKLILVCALALLMAIPALFVYGVVAERTSGQSRALNEVAQRVGGEQAVLGPFIAVPYSRTPNPEKPDQVVYDIAIAFPETGTIDADVEVEIRERGIYEVPVFRSDLAFDARFSASALADALPGDASPAWGDARLFLGVQDTRGLADRVDVSVNGNAVAMDPANFEHENTNQYTAIPPSSLTLAAGQLAGLEGQDTPLTVSARFSLTGADRLSLLPFAKDTSAELTSNWHAPSFTGGVLPTDHTADDDTAEGFEARWRVPYLARGTAGAGNRYLVNQVSGYGARDMAVRFIQPNNPYQSVERALKYGAMFVGFVFLAYFLFEITSKARAHPAQYILVGLAQTIFYLLLLAFAERMGFDAAFAIAAGMTVSLISLYSVSVFRSLRTGANAFGILSGIYALIYVLMRAEDHALLAGALASFAAIAVTMLMTRDVDWYGDRATSP